MFGLPDHEVRDDQQGPGSGLSLLVLCLRWRWMV